MIFVKKPVAALSVDSSVARILKFDNPIQNISIVSESDPDPQFLLKT